MGATAFYFIFILVLIPVIGLIETYLINYDCSKDVEDDEEDLDNGYNQPSSKPSYDLLKDY